MAGTAQERGEKVREALKSGDYFVACDLAEQGLNDHPDDPQLKYYAVLALARAGATAQAIARQAALRLNDLAGETLPRRLKVDIAALAARLVKDQALSASGTQRHALLRDSAAKYRRIFEETGDPFPGVNAATLTLLAGEDAAARELAGAVLRAGDGQAREDYWAHVTAGEAALTCRDIERATRELVAAGGAHARDWGAVASTLRQLRLVCQATGLDPAILAPLQPPTVINFVGHMVGPRFPASAEPAVRDDIAALLRRHNVGFGYGSLAGGADILFAEALLACGAELHTVLPFDQAEFAQVSVRPSGPDWLPRFERCLAKASSVTFATTDEYLGDDGLFSYASQMGMGLALLRANFLSSPIRQMVVWDGRPGAAVGTGADVGAWRARELPVDVIDSRANASGPARPAPAERPRREVRTVRAMLFGDVRGFSKLREAQLPVFVREIWGRFGDVIARHRDGVLFRNTWGDGLYIVAAAAPLAAELALDLQDVFRALDLAAHGLPDHLGLRLGGHIGPVFEMHDAILDVNNFMGVHVSRTARIEPVTPVGAVYVTEPFAAALALSQDSRFTCEYVGQAPAAKGYGVMRFYSLKRAAPPAAH